LLGEVTV